MSYRSYQDFEYKTWKAGKKKPDPQDIWREATISATEAVLNRLAGKSDFKTMENIVGVNANQVARNIGLSNLKDISYYTKVAPTDLVKMFESNPYMFIAICFGVKHLASEQPRLAGEIRRNVRKDLDELKEEKQK